MRSIIILSLMAMLLSQVLKANTPIMEFTFGSQKKHTQAILIVEALPFHVNGQYGFEFGSEQFVDIRSGSRTLFSDRPFYFSVKVPEGNYKVTIGYKGLFDSVYHSTVRSESRRLHLEDIRVSRNKSIRKSFLVNRKDALIGEERYVRLKKPRETGKLDWDDKLTLEFQRTNNIEYIRIEPVDGVRTLFLAGNSTVVNQENEPWASWGQMIPRFFNDKVVVANHAESGLALSSFLSSNRLEKILSVAQPGDYLFIEFGHNDQKEKGEKAGAYNGYTERLHYFVQEFRAIGGIPVILTSTARRSFDDQGVLRYTLGDYPAAARKVAQELNVPLIDLNNMTRRFYEALGVEESKNALVHYPANTFPNQTERLQDNTHFNTYGAYQIAKMVLRGIKENKLPIRKQIVHFSTYNPVKPDSFTNWNWPLSVKHSQIKPDGN